MREMEQQMAGKWEEEDGPGLIGSRVPAFKGGSPHA